MTAVTIDKSRISTPSADVREIAWRYALQRLERFGTGSKDNRHVLPDEFDIERIKTMTAQT